MRCDEACTLMVKQLRGGLAPPEGEALARHLSACAACRAQRDPLAAMTGQLGAIRRPPTPSAAGRPPARESLLRHPANHRCRLPGPAAPAWRWGLPAVVAAAGGAALVPLWLRGQPAAPQLARQPPARTGLRGAPPGPGRPDRPLSRNTPDPAQQSAPRRRPVQDDPARRRMVVAPGPAPRGERLPGSGEPRQTAAAAPAPVPDRSYLDGRDPGLGGWRMVGNERDRTVLRWLRKRLPRVKDDFVRIPLPQVASLRPGSAAAREAVAKYAAEAGVVDARLFQNVTLALKAVSLEELCAQLAEQTGVQLRASRGVGDEKATVFVKDQPARDVLRGVARLFGYFWARSGEENRYRYELAQDLRAQLAEQEMRLRDVNAALVALDDELAAYRPYLGLSWEEVKARAGKSAGPEKARLRRLADCWAYVQLYNRLSAADRAALASGDPLFFVQNDRNPDRRLPDDWLAMVNEQHHAGQMFARGGGEAGAVPVIGIFLDRSELGQFDLRRAFGWATGVRPDGKLEWGGNSPYEPVAIGRSPSASSPDNARANEKLRQLPLFRRRVTLTPEPSCPHFARDVPRESRPGDGEPFYVDVTGRAVEGPMPPHVATADLWEAVHRAAAVPIIADAYSRCYPQSEVTFQETPLLDALCLAADRVGIRWRKDGDLLLCRSTSYFWDRLKEVPNRQLRQWQADRAREGGLPFEDLLQMALLSDQQLDSRRSGQVIQHCWGLEEWGIIGSGLFREGIVAKELRPYVRYLAGLDPAHRQAAFGPEGIAFAALHPAEQEEFARIFRRYAPRELATLRFRCEYAPTGQFVWHPVVREDRYREARSWPLVAGATRETTLTAARRFFPAASPGQIQRSRGEFAITFHEANGDSWKLGDLAGFVPEEHGPEQPGPRR